MNLDYGYCTPRKVREFRSHLTTKLLFTIGVETNGLRDGDEAGVGSIQKTKGHRTI